jgi:hypothetical protein
MKSNDQFQRSRVTCLSFSIVAVLAMYLVDVIRSSASAETLLRTVALSGQSAPGTPSGVSFSALGAPLINSSGDVAFRSFLSGGDVTGSTNDRGIWAESAGSLNFAIRNGSHAPGTPADVNFAGISVPTFNASGRIIFYSTLTGPSVVTLGNPNNVGLWSDSTGTVDLITRSGDPAPGTPSGVNFLNSFIKVEVLNAAGQTAFTSFLDGPDVDGSNGEGIWLGVPGNLTLVARTGSHAPGTASGVNFRQNFSLEPALNDAGQVAFSGRLTDSAANGNTGIWAGAPGALRLVARETMQVPGMPSGIKFGTFNQIDPALNSAGQTAFINTLSNGKRAVYSEESGVFRLVAFDGTPAVGALDGANFSDFAPPVLNAVGQTAFRARLSGSGVNASNDDGIWSEGTGALKLVARSGMAAPGAADGVTFGGIATPFSLPSINALGQTIFSATLTGSGIDSTNDMGIWATDIDGVLKLIVRAGDQLEVASGDLRTISSVGFIGDTIKGAQTTRPTGNEDGFGSGFNDRGQLAFAATFTDGTSGVFVSNLVASAPVPEPPTLALISGTLAIALTLMRNHRNGKARRR